MESDPALRRLVAELNSTLKFETASLQTLFEKWRAGQVELVAQKKALDEEVAAIDALRRKIRDDRDRFEEEVARVWGTVPEDEARRVRLNVGGQPFETSVRTLTRDRFSMLAALCTDRRARADFPVDEDGTVFIDRDWWLFRHVLAFLRSDTLPDDPDLLRQLYVESAFYRLNSLRLAIERHLQERRLPPAVLLPVQHGQPSLEDEFLRRQPSASSSSSSSSFATSTGLGVAALAGGTSLGAAAATWESAQRALQWSSWARRVIGLDDGTGPGRSGTYGSRPASAAFEEQLLDGSWDGDMSGLGGDLENTFVTDGPAHKHRGPEDAAGVGHRGTRAGVPAALGDSMRGLRNAAALLATQELDLGGPRVARGPALFADVLPVGADELGGRGGPGVRGGGGTMVELVRELELRRRELATGPVAVELGRGSSASASASASLSWPARASSWGPEAAESTAEADWTRAMHASARSETQAAEDKRRGAGSAAPAPVPAPAPAPVPAPAITTDVYLSGRWRDLYRSEGSTGPAGPSSLAGPPLPDPFGFGRKREGGVL